MCDQLIYCICSGNRAVNANMRPGLYGQNSETENWISRYNSTCSSRICAKLGMNVLLDDTHALFERKFVIRKFWGIFWGHHQWGWGVVLNRTFADMIGHDEKKIYFFFHKKGKRKSCLRIRKNFWQTFEKSLENQLFPMLRYNPPFDSQTINHWRIAC